MLEIYEIAVKLLLNSTCIQFPLFNKFKFFPFPIRNFFANCLKMKINEQLVDSWRWKKRQDFDRSPKVDNLSSKQRGRFANINYIDETSIIPWTINYAMRAGFSRYQCRVGIHEASRCVAIEQYLDFPRISNGQQQLSIDRQTKVK